MSSDKTSIEFVIITGLSLSITTILDSFIISSGVSAFWIFALMYFNASDLLSVIQAAEISRSQYPDASSVHKRANNKKSPFSSAICRSTVANFSAISFIFFPTILQQKLSLKGRLPLLRILSCYILILTPNH